MKEIESNKHAWGLLSKEHYETFKARFENGTHKLNRYIEKEVGDLSGKSVIHLQCNTGADTMLLARMADKAVGVDLVPSNIHYAKQLSQDLKLSNVDFIAADIMSFMKTHAETYDVVFVSEGAIGWLPDLDKWAKTARHLLNEGGYLYLYESHPFFNMMDEGKLAKGELEVKYPYFDKEPDLDESIGGYAGETKSNVKTYFWMYTISDVLNALIKAGLQLEFFNEYTEIFWKFCEGMEKTGQDELYEFPFNKGKFPISFSLKARKG